LPSLAGVPVENSPLVDFDRDCYSQDRLCREMRRFVDLGSIRNAGSDGCCVVDLHYHTDIAFLLRGAL